MELNTVSTNISTKSVKVTGVSLAIGSSIYFLAGTKNYIAATEILTIPQYYEYNTFILDVDGTVNNNGTINFL